MNQVKLGEAKALFSVLRQSADADVVTAIEALVRDAPDAALNRVNALDFAAKRGVDQERVIAAFLHRARVGLFELSWNVLCPTSRRCHLADVWRYYSITSSAFASSEGGTVRPSPFAVLRLMTNSNLVGCMIGRSAAFAPWRIFPA